MSHPWRRLSAALMSLTLAAPGASVADTSQAGHG